MKSILQRTLVAGLLWLATSVSTHAQGTIRYVPGVELYFPVGSTGWDVNQDGVNEFVFYSDRSSLAIYPQGASHVLALADPPPNIGGDLLPLLPPSEIGNYDYAPAIWMSSLDPSGFAGRAYLNFCLNLGCGGTFYGVRAYFGFNFEIEGETHYGWGLFNASAGSGGYLESYAYNLEPGASIFVGQVPEPGTWVLLTVGLGLLGWRTCRKRQRV